jgi:hypothetical protein
VIITHEIPDATKYAIHDCTGQVIPFVTFYDTDTCEIEMAICLRMEKVDEDENGEIRVVESDEELAKSLKESPRLLMQISSGEGEPKVGYVFVRFALPGSYATFEGQKIAALEAH